MTEEDRRKGQIIIRSARIGLIVCELAKRLGVKPTEALRRFYRSETCRQFHDRRSGLYLYGELYIVEEYMIEIGEVSYNS